MQLNPHSSLPSLVEYLKMLSSYRVMSTKTRLITTILAILIAVMLVIVGVTTKAQMGQTNTQVILNLENGQQYFGVPHVYQGDNYGTPTNTWPLYYGPSTASQYWSQGGISNDQPVLELVPAQNLFAGAIFWSETYSGGSVTISIIGTYSSYYIYPADGYTIYLFLTPTMWGISPQYNYSIPFASTFTPTTSIAASPYEGEIMMPQSSTPYIIVQWQPYWQISGTYSGATGQWDIYIVSNTNGNNPSIGPSPSPNLGSGWAGWDGIGTGAFQPNPGDLIKITVTYDPSTNTLSSVATDLNTGQSASFTLYLANYFTPPTSGNYIFGVGGENGAFETNWALLYVVLMGNVKPSPLTTSTTTPATVTVTTTTTVTSTVTSLVTTTVTSPVTTTVISTVTSPITTTVASTTTTFTVTTTSPVTVTTTVFTTSSIIQTMIIALIIIIVVLAAALVAVTIRRR